MTKINKMTGNDGIRGKWKERKRHEKEWKELKIKHNEVRVNESVRASRCWAKQNNESCLSFDDTSRKIRQRISNVVDIKCE